MKSEHRHELKTNELAEWLGNLPQWTKENLVTIICVSAFIVVLAGVYLWRGYNRNVVRVRERNEFTTLLSRVSDAKRKIMQAQEEGRDVSFTLSLEAAKPLEAFAQSTKNNGMAALALIKRAQALRAELHYGTVEGQYVIDQIGKAKDSYTQALERSAGDNSFAAAAEFGLGLCAEELGDFEKAQQAYRDIVANADYEGTVTIAQAQRRLRTMADYKDKIAFKPNPNPKPAGASQPVSTRMPANIVPPFNVNRPLDFSMFPPEVNEAPGSEQQN
ncbi:MAG: tetratricopeptide repeat protein [Planctomycetota bacterium]